MPAREPSEDSMSEDRYLKQSAGERRDRQMRRHRRATMRELRQTEVQRGQLFVQYHAGVHIKEGFWTDAYRNKVCKEVRQPKLPTNKARWAALEVEYIGKARHKDVEWLLAKAGLGKYVHLKDDGSIETTEARKCPGELVICAELTELPSIIHRVCEVMRSPTIDAAVNRSCGLHIHLDMRNFDAHHAYRNLVNSYNGLLSRIVPRSRVRNSYCKAPTTNDFEDACADDDRYLAVNPLAYDAHNTIEVRIFSGTVNPEKMIQYLHIVSSIAYNEAVVPEDTNTAADFAAHCKWTPNLEQWVKSRAKTFGADM